MNEKKKMYVILAVIAAILVLIPTLILIANKKDQEYLDKIKEKMNGTEPTAIYIARPTCYYCNMLKPITEELKKDYQLDYYEINTDDISNSLLEKVLKLLKVESSSFGTPYIAIVQNGKVIGEQRGYANEASTFEVFKKYGIISKEANLWYVPMTQADFLTKMPESDKKYVFIGNDQESETHAMKSVLKEVAQTAGKQIYYLEIGSEESIDDLMKALGMEKTSFSTPLLISIENGQIVKADANSQSAYESFLK